MPIILALKYRKKDPKFKVILSYKEFKGSLGYVTPSLKLNAKFWIILICGITTTKHKGNNTNRPYQNEKLSFYPSLFFENI